MSEFLNTYFPNVIGIKEIVIESIIQTLYMVIITALISAVFGIIFGVILVVTADQGILENKKIYRILDKLVNLFRSIPFVILLALIAPLTRLIVGNAIGTTAAIVPLVIGTVPFYARQIQVALLEVDPGIIEAAESMGSSPIEIIFRVYLKEGLPSIIRVSSLTVISLIGLTTMAGAIGGGGLGNLAIARGHNRFQTDVTWVATAIILVIVFISQFIGDILVKKTQH